MKIYRGKDYDDAGRIVGNILGSLVVTKPDCVLGLATGSTPISAYDRMVDMYEEGTVDFSNVKTVNLDEYRGLSGSHDQSYRYFMNTHLFDKVNIDKDNTYVPNGLEMDSDKACEDYDRIVDSIGGIDIQLLGLGHNGHIGFNEPADSFSKGTICVNLTESTIDANARFFDSVDSVPKQAYTMGVGTIMNARNVLLMVTGEGKRDILDKAFHGPITPKVPASILQLHPNVILVADEAALGTNF